MTNIEHPAGDNGRANAVSGAEQLTDLPAKLRVHAVAKLLGISSKEVLATLKQLGESVRSAQSSISRDVAERVIKTFSRAKAVQQPSQLAESAEEEPKLTDSSTLTPVFAAAQPLFLSAKTAKSTRSAKAISPAKPAEQAATEHTDGDESADGRRRRRRGRRGRRGRGRGRGNGETAETTEVTPAEQAAESAGETAAETASDAEEMADGNRHRRRRRRRKDAADTELTARDDDPPNTVVHVREVREVKPELAAPSSDDEVRSVKGSTRLEAKRQRRRDGREAGRRRAPILSEAEFLARREAVERKMVVREHGNRVQIAVLEDGVLVEHFVTSAGTGSLVGNVYLGRVQNVLPSMEAAFVDIGKGRNAVLYAGEVDWDAAGLEGKARKIEQALSTGDSVLVQVTKDPVGHKGARLTTQISLPGRFVVYVPSGGAIGISRKLPDTERKRLKEILKRIVPDEAGVIIRTASEGVSEEALDRDVRRLQAQWQVIQENSEAKTQAPQLLYEEPDLLIKVIRDLFTEDFSALIVQGSTAGETIESYIQLVAPELAPRLRRHVGTIDAFTEYRITEQITKALDRKVWLPSGGYLVIDRTEAMTVIDVNTGKFTGSGGNLEETVTRNNLEAAEEIVRQLRLRDVGGIIVVDFIDMVLESNRDLVLRRLTECLGRDRTRHQVAEVTSLGLVQMTRKRVGTGLIEAFSTTCEHCRGRGLVVSTELTLAPPTPAENDVTKDSNLTNGNNTAYGRESRRARHRNRGKERAEETQTSVSASTVVEQNQQTEPASEPVAAESAPVNAVVNGHAALPETEPVVVSVTTRRQPRRAVRRAAGPPAKISPA